MNLKSKSLFFKFTFLLAGLFIFSLASLSVHANTSVDIALPVCNEPGPDPCVVEEPAPTPPGTPADTTPPIISKLEIRPDLTSAIFTWETDKTAGFKLVWGQTQDYEMGELSSAAYGTSHQTKIVGLTPATLYFFQIIVQDLFGNQAVYSGSFTTLSLPDKAPPDNVRDLRADTTENSIILTWQNPDIPDLASIRIIRSDRFYLTDPFGGLLVYEGKGQKFEDKQITLGTRYYYTVFVRNTAGNFSSGALTSALVPVPGVPVPDDDPFIPPPPLEPVTDEALRRLGLFDFNFYQFARELPLINHIVSIEPLGTVTVTIDPSRVPPDTTIMFIEVYGTEGSNWSSAYLLSYNEETERYEARVPGFLRGGNFPFAIKVFSDRNRQFKALEGTFEVAPVPVIRTGWWIIIWLFFFFLLLLLFLLWRRRKKEEDRRGGRRSGNFTAINKKDIVFKNRFKD